MPAAKYHLKGDRRIEQGASYWWGLLWKETAEDLVGKDLLLWSARMQIKSTVSAVTPLLSLTSEALGGIVLGDGTGTENISIHIPPDDTDTLIITSGVYDLELVDPDDEVYRLLEGNVQISLNVTREGA